MNPSLLPHVITLAKRTGHGPAGLDTYSAGVQYKARVQRTSKLVADATGAQIMASAVVYLEGGVPDIDTEDRLTLPDGTTPRLISVKPALTGDGTLDHWEVFI